MEIDRNKLPGDPAALRQMVAGLLEELDSKERRLQQLQHMVEQLLRWRYGPKRERVNENQLFLYAVGIIGTGQEIFPLPEEGETKTTTPRRRGHGRRRLPKPLERRRVVYDLGEQERKCPQCQGDLKHIGEEVSERLEYVPASLYVIEEACQKYACGKGCTVVTAQKPMQPIEKGLPGPGLLAHVAVSKYGDHLPLYNSGTGLGGTVTLTLSGAGVANRGAGYASATPIIAQFANVPVGMQNTQTITNGAHSQHERDFRVPRLPRARMMCYLIVNITESIPASLPRLTAML